MNVHHLLKQWHHSGQASTGALHGRDPAPRIAECIRTACHSGRMGASAVTVLVIPGCAAATTMSMTF